MSKKLYAMETKRFMSISYVGLQTSYNIQVLKMKLLSL
ncbi:hypothetical protein TVAGG3_0905430 [Trichomonas vaginalis G3]|nr:hypothetical protein TVAGG3_0905430 [Trichomonas vaginalis G3]KAI5484017.1 hypothetical protein TVAGG3_0905430 [Trichomonas vaginalis G3]